MFKIKFAVFAALIVAASVSAQQPPPSAPAVVPEGKIAMLNTQVFPWPDTGTQAEV
jgi:hypothetical protein